uniref:Microtubule associated tumor suppressor candidate 2a n=1 Tax=Kryptolebias marmoratus TaxID=37003 RepID=A0A3Q2ZDC1_KRYMA
MSVLRKHTLVSTSTLIGFSPFPSLLPTVQPGQRPAAAVRGSTPSGSPRRVAPLRLQQEHQENLQREKEEAQQKEKERQAEEREKEEQRQEVSLQGHLARCSVLQGSCEQQERQLKALRDELKKMSLGLEAFIITTQHYRLKVSFFFFLSFFLRECTCLHQDALAPYQHIEQDLKSLKEVVEMKNQQIHQQEKKISDLERVAQKNVFLEEKVQVLQQQNEDLKARIDMNLATSRQLSEENANLHESVEKESTEKNPLMSPASSPLHRSFSTSPIPSSPLLSSSPFAGCDSPTHCHGCPRQAQCCSPSHRAAANQNYSPGPNTPTHRASASRFNSNASLQS